MLILGPMIAADGSAATPEEAPAVPAGSAGAPGWVSGTEAALPSAVPGRTWTDMPGGMSMAATEGARPCEALAGSPSTMALSVDACQVTLASPVPAVGVPGRPAACASDAAVASTPAVSGDAWGATADGNMVAGDTTIVDSTGSERLCISFAGALSAAAMSACETMPADLVAMLGGMVAKGVSMIAAGDPSTGDPNPRPPSLAGMVPGPGTAAFTGTQDGAAMVSA